MEKRVIVCVDDEAIILKSLEVELRTNPGGGYIYESALSADEALQIIGELVSDGITWILVISDWLMPGTKGDEFLLTVRRQYPMARTILITGHADDAAIDRVLKEGIVSAVLRKPWSSRDLMQAVQTAVAG